MAFGRSARGMIVTWAAALAACSAGTEDETATETASDAATDTATGSGGGSACDSSLYPCGPFGTNAGDVITNLSFVGRYDSNGDNVITNKDDATTIALSKYYLDTNVRALILSASAQWCSPCRAEQPELQALYEEHGGQLAILEAMVQKLDASPSDLGTIDTWRDEFGLEFDLVVDPSNVLAPYYDISAFPMNMVIDPRTMTIVWQANGGEMDALENAINGLLANPR